MKHLEEKNSRHGALCMSNIMIDHDFHPYLVGIKHPDIRNNDLTEEESIFCAPEVTQVSDANLKSYAYSFGILLYEILMRQPYRSNDQESIEIAPDQPDFIREIIQKCQFGDQNKRITFESIYEELLVNESSLLDDTSFIDRYLDFIKVRMNQQGTLFRPLVRIVPDPSKIKDHTKNSFDYDALEKAFNPSEERQVRLIMMGNHVVGTGEKSMMKGVLIDGPYDLEYLINRCSNREIKDACIELASNAGNPAIYFFDTQGTGDENYSDIMDKVHSILCTISDICINVVKNNVVYDNLKKNLAIIRRAQMTGKIAHLTKVLFLSIGVK